MMKRFLALIFIILIPIIATAQPIPGYEMQCNAGTDLNTSALALESGGNLEAAATSLALIDNALVTRDTTTMQVEILKNDLFGSEIAEVTTSDPAGSDAGLVVRMAGGVSQRDVFDSVAFSSSTTQIVDTTPGATTLLIRFSGTWTATFNVRGNPGSSGGWSDLINLACVDLVSGGPITDITTNGLYACNIAGIQNVRIGTTSYSSGTATVETGASIGLAPLVLGQALPSGANLIGKTDLALSGSDASVNSGNVDATTQRVAIATDDVNLSAIKTAIEKIDEATDTPWNTLYLINAAIAASLATLDDIVSGSEAQVDVVTMPDVNTNTTPITVACSTEAADGDVVAAQGSGNHILIHHLSVQNASDTDNVKFQLRSGSGGSIIRDYSLTAFQALEMNFKIPVDVGANTAFYYDYESGTSADVVVCVHYEVGT